MASHAKNIIFGGAQIFHTEELIGEDVTPKNRAF
jgi:hypothetical protein